MEVELDENGSPKKPPDVDVTVTRYYNNRARGKPYIAAEFRAQDFDKYKLFTVGRGEKFVMENRRRKRSGKHVLMKSVHE